MALGQGGERGKGVELREIIDQSVVARRVLTDLRGLPLKPLFLRFPGFPGEIPQTRRQRTARVW